MAGSNADTISSIVTLRGSPPSYGPPASDAAQSAFRHSKDLKIHVRPAYASALSFAERDDLDGFSLLYRYLPLVPSIERSLKGRYRYRTSTCYSISAVQEVCKKYKELEASGADTTAWYEERLQKSRTVKEVCSFQIQVVLILILHAKHAEACEAWRENRMVDRGRELDDVRERRKKAYVDAL